MTQADALALYTPVPVAIHMWFADGAGWAYHPDLNDEVLETIIRAVTPDLYSSETEAGALRFSEAGMLVVKKSRQAECKDPRAQERNPHLLRVAFFSPLAWDRCARLNGSDEDHFCRGISAQLAKLVLPLKRGPSDDLKIWVAAETPQSLPMLAAADDQTKESEHQSAIESLSRDNTQLKQDNSDLRRINAHLRRAVPTTWQRLAATAVIAMLTAIATTAVLFLTGLLSVSR